MLHRVAGILALVLFTLPAAARAQESQPALTVQQRLDRLVQLVDERRVTQHIPGVALAIVKDDAVVLSKGLGLRDVEANQPVTASTLFAIGSSTKAFTAMLVGALVADGTMAWDDPVTKYLPWFKLADPDATRDVTIRDLLCHRTGLMRTDLLWISGTLTRREILEAMSTAELRRPFRSAWQYSNPMFLAAGEATAAAAGKDWDCLLRERLLAPLGMNSSTTSYQTMLDDPDMSKGYEWDKTGSRFKNKNPRDLPCIAPAGAINSSVNDMAHWLRFQLARGKFNGTQIVPASIVEETWTPQLPIGPEMPKVSYGLGWMIGEVDGRRVIHHGGNIDGFGAMVGFFPDDNIGFVLLTNTTANALQSEMAGLVNETMLKAWSAAAPPPDPEQFEPFLGRYFFEPMNANMTVLVQNGVLAVDVPGQMIYDLKPPDENGRRVFAITDAIAVSFQQEADGRVTLMRMEQGGLTFELPREGVIIPQEISPEDASKYLGRYRADMLKSEMTVLHRNGRLAIDVPGQMIYDLRLPDEQSRWVFRASDGISIIFSNDDAGAVTGLTMFQSGMEFLCPRVGDGAPAADQVKSLIDRHLAVYGSEKLASLGGIRMIGKSIFRHQGMTGVVTATTDGLTRFSTDVALDRVGGVRTIVTPESVQTILRGEEPVVESGEAVCKAWVQNPLLPSSDWATSFASVELLRNETFKDRPCHVVRLRTACGAETTVLVDAETDLIHQQSYVLTMQGIPIPVTVTYDDWREVGGVLFPFKSESDNEFLGTVVGTMDSVETGIAWTDKDFAP
jgi:CubicO group peptidase (beta-lactamase class C family)